MNTDITRRQAITSMTATAAGVAGLASIAPASTLSTLDLGFDEKTKEYTLPDLPYDYDALAPHDPEGILQHEWANSRGCIARFMRGSIEIRVVDIQECPAADLAVVALITAAVKAMYNERWITYEEQKSYDVKTLHEVLLDTIRYAERTRIMSAPFLRAFGWSGSTGWAGDMWIRLYDELLADHAEFGPTLKAMLHKGTLSARINQTIGRYPDRPQLKKITEDLASCLAEGRLYGC